VLPEPIQQAIKGKKVSAATALEIAKLPEERQVAVFDASKDSNGHVKASEVKNARREDGEPVPRTAKHLRAILAELNGPAENPDGRKLIKSVLAFLDGKISDEQLYDRWQKICPVHVTSE
jgi:hypothetical protein